MASFDLSNELGAREYLNSRIGSCTSVVRLSGGFSAWVYRATFEKPLSNGSKTAVVKHVQNHFIRAFWVQLDASRVNYEERALKILPGNLHGGGVAALQIPELLDFDADTHTVIMSDAGDVPSLRSWLTASRSATVSSHVGSTLGTFLAGVHDLSSRKPEVLTHFADNVSGRKLSASVYFGSIGSTLGMAAERYEHSNAAIRDAGRQAETEVLEASDVLTLGDFWSGNVLVDEGEPGSDVRLTAVDFELAKPGTAAFDVGQMAAEMYCLQRFRDKRNGKALLDGFLGAYARKRSIDPAKVAIRVGAHLIIMGPFAWTSEAGADAVRDLVAEGAVLVTAGWTNDTEILKASLLAPLFV